jgi:hypothetical protein
LLDEELSDPDPEVWLPLPEAEGLLGLSTVGTGFTGMLLFSVIDFPEPLFVFPFGCCFCLLITN